ncbi:SIT4 phosphatase-associated protein [Cordyceps fumosorosea ARSEF 2679]|uniref:SIT4 phosphatase-associated protein n=1 Tax=Cordyceps fumosorosea (strain ARSEF 2679) TaxID=1081104 RepID=A0A167VXT1_CORFA|nr:SIT4 phosphatase-associated protein [Cordyceps fumosorosea ARSEF 2679]OAA63099.1 SIT4 phosphatase-associated protein [Cordyceps fumosorosea ARSEF 2679]
MFWRFGGYANISTIDTILDKTDFTLEELLDESDLIQELKQHNSKLIEYLREDAILKRLLEYVVAPKLATFETSQDNQDDLRGRNRLMTFSRPRASSRNTDSAGADDPAQEKRRNHYALVAAEVLSSDTWSIYESLTDNKQLIKAFWEFLSRPAPLDPLQASYFTKVNESLFEKKTEEMIELLRSLPNAIPDMLRHVECPMIMDLLLKIIAMDRTEGGHGIVEWLYSKDIISTLLSFISPEHSWVVQTAAGDFIKAIITISANASQNEQQCIGPNELTRQLVSKECVDQLVGYMLHGGNPLTVGVGIIIEVIRKNNSDYDPDVLAEAENEPSSRDPIYLGTLLRLFADNVPNFMSLIMEGPAQAKGLASTFGEKLEPLGFDRFKTCELMAELLHCSNMGLLNESGSEQLIAARDSERQRMREAGLLFPARDDDTASDNLTMRQGMPTEGRRLEVTNPNEDGFEEVDAATEEAQKQEKSSIAALKDNDDFVDEPLTSPKLDSTRATEQQYENPELVVAPLSPIKAPSAEFDDRPEAPSGTSDLEVPTVSESSVAEQEAKLESPATAVDSITRDTSKLDVASPSDTLSLARELSPHPEDTPAPLFSAPPAPEPPAEGERPAWDDMQQDTEPSEIIIAHVPEVPAAPELDMPGEPVVGDYLKQQFVEHRVVPTILSFFFKYPWNNFLHNVVYDVVQQVFNGPMDRGYNPTLAVSLFEAADVTTAIIEGQQASDKSQAKTKTRMGYMGHLTLIAEEVVKFTERHPPELLSETVLDRVMSAGWINYVEGALAETRERDNAILGGVRPEVALGQRHSLGPGGIGGLTGLSNTPAGATALAEAGLNGGMELSDNTGGGMGQFAISGGAMISGFGSSSDEDDDDGEGEDEDINTEFRSFAEHGGSLDPPSIPPPPPPPPLNIPPSRARLQLAARLAMHQKSREDNAAFSGSFNGFDDEDEDDDDDDDNDARNATDPFADVDDDDLDDDLDDDEPHHGGRGAWWRDVVSKAPGAGAVDQDDSDDEEFGDFAMAEDERGGGSSGARDEETTPERVLLKPLAVNPVKEAARGLSGLWPFGSRAETTAASGKTDDAEADEDEGEVIVPPATGGDAKASRSTGPVEAKEGIRRTNIEEVDDDEVINFK